MVNPFAVSRRREERASVSAGTDPLAEPARARRVAALKPKPPFNGKRAIAGLTDLPKGTRLVLPWPPAKLNPNARHKHPAQKAGIAAKYREECWALTLEAFGSGSPGKRLFPGEGRIAVRLDMFPPTGQRRDDDNVVAAFKSGRDGVAQALGIDDHRFIVTPVLRPEVRGCMVLTFTEGETR